MAFISCQKDIQLQPEVQLPKLVVDAQIETNQPPVVILTNSINYFSEINSSLLTNSFVRNAVVTISNGILTHRLKEYAVVNNGITYYFYSNDIANPSTSFIGENGKQYDLRIETDGQVYTSTTRIPVLTKKIDSIWWKKPPVDVDTTFATVMTKITDPAGLGNYIRYFTKRGSNNQFLPGYNSVFDDQVIDGKTYDIPVTAGVDRNKPALGKDSSGYFFRGDTVTVKFCNIDQNTYKFWNTWEFAFQAVGNPFSSPIKITNNISNNALGAFCGYATQFKTVIIPK
jgi:hypothetical protein